ncbi:MAG: alpha/beta hydrolase [Lachnospiraceae bacterium]|nr:alpha/beta hydrolase [Lachnospiraceae bacterium]
MFYKETETIDGKQLSYVRFNEWKEDIILFFHGFTGSKEYFPGIENDNVCLLSFDRPGVGDSDVVPYYTMESFLQNVYDVLKKHGVSSVKLIGHSAGGYYAQVFARMFPDIVKALSLLGSMIPLNCPDTKCIVKGQWKFITKLSLRFKGFSKFYFKQMAKSITGNYENQLAANMKTLPDTEKKFMEENPVMIKNAVINAVANDGLGVCYDAYALCQKREKITISEDIPVYIWYGKEDTTIPASFIDYLKSVYMVKNTHMIDDVGHMLYLSYWEDIIRELYELK